MGILAKNINQWITQMYKDLARYADATAGPDISSEVLNSSLEYIIKNKERLDEHIEDKQHFMSYCKLKIKNQLIDYYRKEKNIESIYRENDEGDLEMKEELFYDNTKKSFTSHDNIMDLNKALSKLSSKCRELLLLWGEGYSEKELSVKYGKTASTIGVQTHRCLKKLIPLFKGDELKVN
jgi:RNA polymerase sigma factor (sigma-70 family)